MSPSEREALIQKVAMHVLGHQSAYSLGEKISKAFDLAEAFVSRCESRWRDLEGEERPEIPDRNPIYP